MSTHNLMPHIHDKIDFTVETFVVCRDTVFLRKHDKYKFWLGVGGHIELDEDPNQAALREVKEEAGMDVKLLGAAPSFHNESEGYRELIPPEFLNRHRIGDSHEHVSLIYFAVAKTKDIRQGAREVSEACRWFTEKELDDPTHGIRDSIKFYAKAALAAAAHAAEK